MNTPANGVDEFPVDTKRIAPAAMSETRPMSWSIRRELWENRSIYLAPLIVTAVVLFATSISTMGLPNRMRKAAPANAQAAVSAPFRMAPAPIMLATFVVGIFYCLDALYGERRDRSILFWKSLPVSDRTTVLSKASIPLLVLPLIAFALSVVTQLVLVPLTVMVLLGRGIGAAPLMTEIRFFQGLLIMIYGLTVHVLWFAPIYCGLLLISAWARRAPVMWAVLPLVAISAVERIAFNTSLFMSFLQYRVTGAMTEAFIVRAKGSGGNFDRLSQLAPAKFLSAPGLWVGLIFAAACLAAAVRLRRNREPR